MARSTAPRSAADHGDHNESNIKRDQVRAGDSFHHLYCPREFQRQPQTSAAQHDRRAATHPQSSAARPLGVHRNAPSLLRGDSATGPCRAFRHPVGSGDTGPGAVQGPSPSQNIDYDAKAKCYVLGDGFESVFEFPPERVLAWLTQGFGDGEPSALRCAVVSEIPSRLTHPDLDVLASLTRAIHSVPSATH
jgi:hypothetical protein